MYIVKTPEILKRTFDSIVWSCESDPRLRITFDDGPHPESTPYLLDLLSKYDLKATFFCVGLQVEKHNALYESIVHEGHAVGNHSYSHTSGWNSKLDQYITDIDKASEYIESEYFRPPYGKLKWRQYQSLKKKYKIVLWDVLTWDFKSKVTSQFVLDSVKDHVQKNSIILFHDKPSCLNKITPALEFLGMQKFI